MEPFLIRFSDPAAKWLRSEAKRLGISFNELLRRIVDETRNTQFKKEGL
jgi:hypothetical protein